MPVFFHDDLPGIAAGENQDRTRTEKQATFFSDLLRIESGTKTRIKSRRKAAKNFQANTHDKAMLALNYYKKLQTVRI